MDLGFEGKIRCICHSRGKGSLNMAIDEALSITVGKGLPVIRFYGFSPPALSVGRFQKTDNAIFFQELKKDGLDFVRRPTGGQAVLHDNELTYSVILARTHFSPFNHRKVYQFISSLLIEGLKTLGISSSFSTIRTGQVRNPDCFASTGEYEIITASGRKIIGSAQTTTRTSCLQHGAIPLDNSFSNLRRYLKNPPKIENLTPSSLEEELGRPVGFKEALLAFQETFGKSLDLENSELTGEEKSISDELIRAKYESEEWNLKR